MKSIVKGEKEESTYPCLKEHMNEYGKIVVLFIAPRTGIVVFSDGKRNRINPMGEIAGMALENMDCNKWWGEESFTPFNGVIELSNN